MSKTEGRELYRVLSVEKRGVVSFRWDPESGGFTFVRNSSLWRFDIYYYTLHRRPYICVEAKDELDAFIQGQAHLDRLKAAYERRKVKLLQKEQTG